MKKFLILALTLIIALTFAFSLIGCKDNPPRTPSEQEDPYVPDIEW